ncbi:dad family protein, partial [Colletotrichum incanum]
LAAHPSEHLERLPSTFGLPPSKYSELQQLSPKHNTLTVDRNQNNTTMAPKRTASSQKAAAAAVASAEPPQHPPSSPAGPTAAAAIPGTMTSQPKAVPITMTPKGASSGAQNWDQVLTNIYNHYVNNTPQRTKLIDAFMAFLVVVGALQFLYCVLAGNFPFNAFLSGFSATVGQFVLTGESIATAPQLSMANSSFPASLRIQTTEANKSDFPSVSPERAFADYVACSLILHFFCVNFIN